MVLMMTMLTLIADQFAKLIEAREKAILAAGESGSRSAWKEALLTSRLAVPVALMGDSGHGKTTLFELLRLNLSPPYLQHQLHDAPAVRGVPTINAQECVLSLPRGSGQINLIDLPGTHTHTQLAAVSLHTADGAQAGDRARVKNFLSGLIGSRCALVTISALAAQVSSS
jgi:MoxR-like ATPase